MSNYIMINRWWKLFNRQLAVALRKSRFEERTKADIQANMLRFEKQLKETYDKYLMEGSNPEEFRAEIIGILIKVFKRVGIKISISGVKAAKDEIYGMDDVFKSISAWLKTFLEQRPLKREAA